jgi:hypothetical protein
MSEVGTNGHIDLRTRCGFKSGKKSDDEKKAELEEHIAGIVLVRVDHGPGDSGRYEFAIVPYCRDNQLAGCAYFSDTKRNVVEARAKEIIGLNTGWAYLSSRKPEDVAAETVGLVRRTLVSGRRKRDSCRNDYRP